MDPSDLLLRPPSRQRSCLIRVLAQWLPLPAVKRIHFQEELLRSVQTYQEQIPDTDRQSDDESIRNMWYTPTPVTLADLTWLIRDEGEEGILLRCQLFGTDPVLSSTPVSFRHKSRRVSMQCGAHGHASIDIHNQTPINSSLYGTSFHTSPHLTAHHHRTPPPTSSFHTSPRLTAHHRTTPPTSSFQTPDMAAMVKIGELENELLQLRQQLAAIAIKQEQMANNSSMDAAVPTDPSVIPPMPAMGMCGAPPPPPPPPPPLPPSLLATPQISIKDIIKKNKSTKASKPHRDRTQPDMTEILKGLGNVKLRSIKRSPGGTPVREKPRPCNVNDPVFMIAQALKKKFAACQVASPDKENSPSAGGFTPSPCRDNTPPRAHYLAIKLKRRSRTIPLRDLSVNK